MREQYVNSSVAAGEDGSRHRFDYYILTGALEVNPRFSCESYGIKVSEVGGDVTSIPDITISASRIDALLELLTRNAVGPASVREVVEDWL